MPHIHTAPGEHDHTVTAYIIKNDGSAPRAFLHLHRKQNKLLPVGGHIELDETPWQAVVHEIQEESGYNMDQLTILQPKERIKRMDVSVMHPYPVALNTHPIGDDHFHSDISYAFITDQEPAGIVAAGESTDIRWLTLAELHQLDANEVASGVREVYDFIFDVCLQRWEQVSVKDFK